MFLISLNLGYTFKAKDAAVNLFQVSQYKMIPPKYYVQKAYGLMVSFVLKRAIRLLEEFLASMEKCYLCSLIIQSDLVF